MKLYSSNYIACRITGEGLTSKHFACTIAGEGPNATKPPKAGRSIIRALKHTQLLMPPPQWAASALQPSTQQLQQWKGDNTTRMLSEAAVGNASSSALLLPQPLPDKLVLQLVPKDAASREYMVAAGLNCNVELSVK